MSHHKKTVIEVIAVIAVAFVLGLLFGGKQGTNITGNSSVANPSGSGTTAASGTDLAVSIVNIHDASAPLYKLAIEYPQFTSAPADLNTSISNFVNSNLASFKQTVQENWDARNATQPTGTPPMKPEQIYYFDVSWQPAQLNAHYVSFVVRIESFQGGANEDDQLMTFNYDLQAHAAVSLASLFPKDPNYLTTISTLARQQLSASLNSASGGYLDTDMLNQGTTPALVNFQDFTFTDDVITIYFPKYQVAAGVAGEQQIVIVRNSL